MVYKGCSILIKIVWQANISLMMPLVTVTISLMMVSQLSKSLMMTNHLMMDAGT